MRKKAVVGATITWIIATIILVLVITIFISGAVTIAVKQRYSGELNQIIVEEGRINSDLALQKSIESLLSKEVEFNNESIPLFELLWKNEEEASKIFVKNSENVFEEIFDVKVVYSDPWWFRVYETGERIEKTNVRKDFWAGGLECNPLDKEESLIMSNIIGNKRIVLCLDKGYYQVWRKLKHEQKS